MAPALEGTSEWTMEVNQTRIDAILRAASAGDDEDSERITYIVGAALLVAAMLLNLAWCVVAILRRLCGNGGRCAWCAWCAWCACCGGGPCADGGAAEDGLGGCCWGADGAGDDDEDADDAEHEHGVEQKDELEAADEGGEDSGADVRAEQEESHSDSSDDYAPYQPSERKAAVYRGPATSRAVRFAC